MRIDPKYKIRDIVGEKIIIQQGSLGADMTKIISLNESAELLFNSFVGAEFDIEDVAAVLIESYDVDAKTAMADASRWAQSLIDCGVITK